MNNLRCTWAGPRYSNGSFVPQELIRGVQIWTARKPASGNPEFAWFNTYPLSAGGALIADVGAGTHILRAIVEYQDDETSTPVDREMFVPEGTEPPPVVEHPPVSSFDVTLEVT